MRDVCADFGVDLRELDSEDRHIQPLVAFPPTVAIFRLVVALLNSWHCDRQGRCPTRLIRGHRGCRLDRNP